VDRWVEISLTILGTVGASTGFWTYFQKKAESRGATHSMLLGLGHDRIMYLGMCFIEQGWISQDEYENLNDYLYIPYKKMNGNGSVARIMEEIHKLPIRKSYDYKAAKTKCSLSSCMPKE